MSLFAGATVDVPTGVIMPWVDRGSNAPPGWVYCDGNNGTPDLRGRFIRGGDGNTYDIGDTGGQESVALSESELPSHSHSLTTDTESNHSHELGHASGDLDTLGSGEVQDEWDTSSSSIGDGVTSSTGEHQHTFNIEAEGKGATGNEFSNKPFRTNVSFIQRV
jgi:microcystin-dependent protein